MKLIKTEILNFRSIKKETVDFEPACRVLVGINESGKSNILKSLSFLSNDYMPSRKDDVRESLPNEDEVKEARVKFFFRLDKVESEKVYSKVALNILTKQKDPNIVQYGEKLMGLKELCNLCNDVRYNIDLIQENKTFKHAAFDNSMTLCNNWKKLNKLEDTEITINNKKINLKNFTLINLDDFPEFSHSFFEDGKIESLQNIIGSALIEVAQSYLQSFP